MILETLSQVTDIPLLEKNEVNVILTWIISTLIVFIIALFVYLRQEIKGLKSDVDKERDYSRLQDNKNIALLETVNQILRETVKTIDKSNQGIVDIKHDVSIVLPIIQSNVGRLEGIKEHLITVGK